MGFSSLNIAVTGLIAAQRAMDTVGQNVVNANTPGYSRQRVQLTSMGIGATAAYHTGTKVTVGGVIADGVLRIRDSFLEGARAAAGARMQALGTHVSALTGVEQLLSEPGDAGLQATLDDFYAAWHDLGQRPTDSATGAVVIQRGRAVADQLRFVSNGIAERWTRARDTLENVVSQANQAAADVAELNQRIREGTAGGLNVNELMDQRDQLVRRLGELVGGAALPGPDGTVTVSVNGIVMVSDDRAERFALEGASTFPGVATDGPPVITWGGSAVPVESGQAAGLVAALGTEFPGVAAEVDAVANLLRDSVNSLHGAGFTLDGAAGGDFFTGDGALTIDVAFAEVSLLAVSDAPGSVNGHAAVALGDLSDDRVSAAVLGESGPSERWRDLSSDLGVRVQSMERAAAVQSSVLATADEAVEGDAGVSIDEEMTNMILFERAYQASSRVITTVDEMLDTLINRTGVVGR